jgi:hypothetical protein
MKLPPLILPKNPPRKTKGRIISMIATKRIMA